MILRHATLRRNLPSIRRQGILISKSQGKRRAIWLHSHWCSEWAMLHTVRRHGGRVEDVVILEVEVSAADYRSFGPGLGWFVKDISWRAVRRVIGFEEISRSPVDV